MVTKIFITFKYNIMYKSFILNSVSRTTDAFLQKQVDSIVDSLKEVEQMGSCTRCNSMNFGIYNIKENTMIAITHLLRRFQYNEERFLGAREFVYWVFHTSGVVNA